MDIDWARAQQLTMEEQVELMKTGKCFSCKQSGHLSCNCPRCAPWSNTQANTSKVKEREEEDPPQYK